MAARIWIALFGLLIPVSAASANCPTWHTLTNGTTASASDVMDNFGVIIGCPYFTGNVGIGTGTPNATLDVAGVINGRNYEIPDTGGMPQWAKIGTFAGAQDGETIRIVAYIHNGFNADNGQDGTYAITFKTSNGSSVDGNGFAGNGSYYDIGFNGSVASGYLKWKANASGVAATAFDLYIYLPSYTNASHYQISVSAPASWKDIGAIGQSDPGSASSSVLIPNPEFDIPIGSVGIGTTNPPTTLDVVGDIRVGTSGSNGCLQNFAGTALAGTCSSDARLKTVVGSVTGTLAKLSNLQLVRYRWNKTAERLYRNSPSVLNAGFIAQAVEKQFPELVSVDKKGYRQLDYTTLSLYGLEAIKELKAENDRQAAELRQLKLKNAVEIQKIRVEQASQFAELSTELRTLRLRLSQRIAQN